MASKNYKHIAVENPIAKEFELLRKNLGKFKRKPTNTETMQILLEKNQRITLPKEDILKILLNPYEDD